MEPQRMPNDGRERRGMSTREINVDRLSAMTIAVMTIATLFMLQGTRVFVSYLVFVVDQSQRVTLGLSGLAVFAAPVMVLVLVRLLPAHRVVTGAVGLLIAARLIMQFWEDPTGRVFLGAVTIVAWGWIVIVALDRNRQATALGILAAIALDIMIRMGLGSVDLPWMPGLPQHLLTVILALTLGVAATTLKDAFQAHEDRPRLSILPLVALGPALALHHIATGNLALGHSTTGQDRATVWVAMLAGVALGYFALTIFSMFSSGEQKLLDRIVIGIATVLGGLGLGLIWAGNPPSTFGLVAAPAGFFILVAAILSGRPTADGKATISKTAIAVTAGLVIKVGLIFIYHTFTGFGPVIPVAWLLIVAAAFWSSRLTSVPFLQTTGRYGLVARVVVLLVFVLPVAAEISATEPAAEPLVGDELTVMVFNIQSGFSLDRTWDLRETAAVIRAEDPDIVVLNEVSRGWLVTAASDQLIWLSRELEMPYVWGPASDDGLWGNAILSRVEIEESAVRRFASTQNLKRSAIGIAVQISGQELWVIGTHLDNPSGAGAARMEQVTELLDFWDGRQPAIIMGDFNADPDDDVLLALAEMDFADPGLDMDPEVVTSEDGRRIDYIITSPGVDVLEIFVPDVDASDHKPVVARVRLGD
jgi:endonuclease/exonuclease/phosphatase family metal-dependent hydrolase